MMEKILLIDDRMDEQKILLNQYEIDLSVYADILDNLTGKKADDFFQKIDVVNEHLIDYRIWIIHQTIFDKLKGYQRRVEKFCKLNDIKLVLFSGAIPKVLIKTNLGLLKLSREDLYKNLKTFLDHYTQNGSQLEILGFGNDWKVLIMLDVENAIENFLITTGSDVDIRLFRSKVNLDSVKDLFDNREIFNMSGLADRKVIVSLLNDLKELISEQMDT